MDIEKRRGITVRASTTSIIWNGVKCNIIERKRALIKMKKIYGIILGVILASAIFFAFDKYMENEIQENKEEVRNHCCCL